MAIVQRIKSARWHWPLLFSVFFLNLCLPSLILSFGVLLVHSVDLGVSIQRGLATPTLFILTYSLSQCWCREAADSWGGYIGFRVMAVVGLTIVVTGLLICSLIPYHLHIYVYGITGGIGTSMISAQADAVIFESYDSRLGTIRAVCCTGQAIGLIVFPHALTALVNYYGYSLAHVLIAGIMLQCMPVILLLKVDESIKRPISYSRYRDAAKTYAMVAEQTSNSYYSVDLELHDLSKKCWKSPSDDNLHREILKNEVNNCKEFEETVTPPPSPEESRRNMFGIDILPDIPEESEESDIDSEHSNIPKKRFSFAIKRLSILSDNLGECISNQIRRDSLTAESKDYQEVDVHHDNISPVTDVQREIILNSFSFRFQSAYAVLKRKVWMPSYRIYRLRRRFKYGLSSFKDTFIKPLNRSLSCWKFYPSLLLFFSKLCLTSITLVKLPLMASKLTPRISMLETNFMMSLFAFTWLCFLISTPWLVQTVKRNLIYVTTVGLIISTISCFVLFFSNVSDMFSIGCVIGGLGYGSVISCSDAAIQEFVGSRKWPKIQSSLETLSGILLALFLAGILFRVEESYGLQHLLFILGIVLSITALIWSILSIVSIYTTKIKYARISRG